MRRTDETLTGDATAAGSHVAEIPRRDAPDRIGRYQLLEELGAGGMGVVYRAKDPDLARDVAIKLLPVDTGAGDIAQARLVREAQTMARLAHPNVVAVHDVGIDQGDVFIAMELVEGGTLHDWLDNHDSRWKTVWPLFEQAGRGLAAAHAARLVHRDFKPENVLVGTDGRARVTDFGLARPAEDAVEDPPTTPTADGALALPSSGALTRTGAVLGTPRYMSPEQRFGASVEAATDQYSFCVALHEALFGDLPYGNPAESGHVDRLMGGEIRYARPNASVSLRKRNAIARGLALDPPDRWPTMDALLAELGRGQRRWWVVGGLAGVGAIATAGLLATGDDEDPCAAAGAPIHASWTADAQSQIETRFRASNAERGDAAWARTEARLDDYAQRWSDAAVAACRATHVEHTQSPELLDRKMACLHERASAFTAIVELLRSGERQALSGATGVGSWLPAIDICESTDGLSGLPQPDDEAARVRVQRIRELIAAAGPLREAGALTTARPLVDEALQLAGDVDYDPLTAEVEVEAARLAREEGDPERAESLLIHAARTAQRARYDRVAASATIDLVSVVGVWQGRYREARVWAQNAEAACDRVGDDECEADLMFALGHLALRDGDPKAALEAFSRRLELHERSTDDQHVIGTDLSGLVAAYAGVGDYVAAGHHAQRAADLLSDLGLDHPHYLTALRNLAASDVHLGRGENAAEIFEKLLAASRRNLGPDHAETLDTWQAYGTALVSSNRFEDAARELGQLVDAYDHKEGAVAADHAMALLVYGHALDRLGRREESITPRRRAVEVTEPLGDHPQRAEALQELGRSLLDAGELDAADAMLIRAEQVRTKTLGAEHPDNAMVYSLRSSIAEQHSDLKTAIELRRKAVELRRRVVGPDHFQTRHDEMLLAGQYVAAGDCSSAIELVDPVLDSLDRGSIARGEAAWVWARCHLDDDRSRAIALAEEAARAFEDNGLPDDAATLREWIAER